MPHKKATGMPPSIVAKEVELDDDEFITSFSGRTGEWTDQISFATSTGAKHVFGGNGGDAKNLEITKGCVVISLGARTDDHLRQTQIRIIPQFPVSKVVEKGVDPLTKTLSSLSRQVSWFISSQAFKRIQIKAQDYEK